MTRRLSCDTSHRVALSGSGSSDIGKIFIIKVYSGKTFRSRLIETRNDPIIIGPDANQIYVFLIV